MRGADRDGIARVPAGPGTPVHAVMSGTVIGTSAAGIAIRAADGSRTDYAGVRPGVREGAAVAAGDIVGAGVGEPVEIGVRAASDARLDAVDVLLGLPDPNDLGYAAPGVGVDPYAIDRDLVPDDGAGG
ncbi:hypothetical protein BJF78_34725 [Pseudonocardia sp. CNS-139]|nr:hypothetical protein BJF78_34725 [Pseudonocardia sp. CNS-139]